MAPRRKQLTDKHVSNLKPAAAGTRYDMPDTETPGLFVRVTEKGTKTFVLYTRFPGSTSPSRRALGEYGELTLAAAREKARQWKALIKRGVDPRIEEEKERAAQQRKRDTTFGAVVADFIAEKLPTERRRESVMRELKQFNAWKTLPIAEITDQDVLSLIKLKKRTAPVQARNLLSLIKRFFVWAIDQRQYGLTASPCAGMKAKAIIGPSKVGDRVLSSDEIFALWRASERISYPHGAVYKMLMLTALRLNEAADAAWPEFDMAQGLWTIPGARMKGKNDKPRPHGVPLTDDITAVLESLPRFKGGSFIFSTTAGASPVWLGDKIKKRMDARMLRTLRALARLRGEDPTKVALPRWTNHDIRRTVRTGLSSMRISEVAREAVLAHARPGISAVYDQHTYIDEKRDALEQWAARLRSISAQVRSSITDEPANVVVPLRA